MFEQPDSSWTDKALNPFASVTGHILNTGLGQRLLKHYLAQNEDTGFDVLQNEGFANRVLRSSGGRDAFLTYLKDPKNVPQIARILASSGKRFFENAADPESRHAEFLRSMAERLQQSLNSR